MVDHRDITGKGKNLELMDYLNGEAIDENLWKEIKRIPGNYIHPLGLIRDRFGRVSAGWIEQGKIYRAKTLDGKKYFVHTLVAEVFLNDNEKIDKSLEVDHIDGNANNNRLNNLRICSHKENMQNVVTRKRLSKEIIDPLGITFNSITECAKFYDISRKTLTELVKAGNHGFRLSAEKNNTENNK